jgi:hypothetical protein
MACILAIGERAPDMYIFQGADGVELDASFTAQAKPYSIAIQAPKSMMTRKTFGIWYERIFKRHVVSKMRGHIQAEQDDDYIVLILDSHDTHVYDTKILNDAWSHKILLLNLPGHCTHLLQPLDSGIFTAFRTHYRKNVTWLAETFRELRVEVSLRQVPFVCNYALDKAFSMDNIRTGQ